MTRMITAMFDTRAEADAAADHLARDIGIQRSAVQVHGGEAAAGTSRTPASAAAGAEDVGFWSALRDLFVPDEDRPTYAEGIRRGSFLVTAEVDDTAVDRAMDLLESHGAVDLDTREAQWRAGGWSGQESMGTGTVASLPTSPELGVAGTTRETITERPGGAGGDFTTNPAPGQMDSASDATRRTGTAGTTTGRTTDEVIPVVEERIQIGKRDVERGRVRVRSYIVERPVSEQVTLRGEHVEVQRRRVDRPATANDDLFRERTIEAVERGEEAVVAKETRVTEEVVLRKDATERTETVTDTVRHTEVKVEDDTTTKGTHTDARLGTRHGSAPDGTPGNPPGTMASRGMDKTLGTNVSGANPQGENLASRAKDKTTKP
jgi:uncharacterized protein (TIGR02271 family)